MKNENKNEIKCVDITFTVIVKHNDKKITYTFDGFGEFYERYNNNENFPMEIDNEIVYLHSEYFDFSKMEINDVCDLLEVFDVDKNREDTKNLIVAMIGYGFSQDWEDYQIIEALLNLDMTPAQLEFDLIVTGFDDMAYSYFQLGKRG